MYVTETTEKRYFFCRWNEDLARWEYTHRFENLDEMLYFVAQKIVDCVIAHPGQFYSIRPEQISMKTKEYPDHILGDVNFSGSDTMIDVRLQYYDFGCDWFLREFGERRFRNKCFMDENARIIDPRIYESAILEKVRHVSPHMPVIIFKPNTPLAKRNILRSKRLQAQYTFRKDPVPNLSRHWGKFGRKRKTWCHNMRLTSIPEYGSYTRPKACVKNTYTDWDMEHTERSWKRQ